MFNLFFLFVYKDKGFRCITWRSNLEFGNFILDFLYPGRPIIVFSPKPINQVDIKHSNIDHELLSRRWESSHTLRAKDINYTQAQEAGAFGEVSSCSLEGGSRGRHSQL